MIKNYFMKDTPFKIYYVADDFTTGLTDVGITIKKSDGTYVVSSQLMTELEQGIYYYDFIPTEVNTFVAEANSTSKPSKGARLYQVKDKLLNLIWDSNSIYRVFYHSKNNISGLIDVKITVWNETTKIIDNATMTESSTPGIYYYDVPLQNSGNYVFKVDSLSNPSPDVQSINFIDVDLTNKYVFTSIDGTARNSIQISGVAD